MRRSLTITTVLMIAGAFVAGYQVGTHRVAITPPIAIQSDKTIETAFSPEQGATDLVIKTIASAKTSVRMAAYSFTSLPIADALIAASKTGIDVRVVVDSSNRKGKASKLELLRQHNVPIRLNDQFAIMHNKFLIIDGKTVQTGSFNYTAAAEGKNAENIVVLHNAPEIASRYNSQWTSIWQGATEN